MTKSILNLKAKYRLPTKIKNPFVNDVDLMRISNLSLNDIE